MTDRSTFSTTEISGTKIFTMAPPGHFRSGGSRRDAERLRPGAASRRLDGRAPHGAPSARRGDPAGGVRASLFAPRLAVRGGAGIDAHPEAPCKRLRLLERALDARLEGL